MQGTLTGKLPSALGPAAAAASLPVALANEHILDQYITGAAGQTAAGNNILLAVAGTAALDCQQYRSIAIQINVTGTITAGVISFEGSNDNVNFVAVSAFDTTNQFSTLQTITLATGVNRFVMGAVSYRYYRARISTGITGAGGSVQAFTMLRMAPFTANLITTNAGVAGVNAVGGTAAHSAASTGNPVRIAGRTRTTLDTTLVDGDVSDLFVSSAGQLVQKPYGSAENDFQATGGTTAITGTTATTIKAAAGAGLRNYLTEIQLYNTHASVSTNVQILDGAAVIWIGWLPAMTSALVLVPAIVIFQTPLRGTANTAMNIALGTTGANVLWNAQGYQAA